MGRAAGVRGPSPCRFPALRPGPVRGGPLLPWRPAALPLLYPQPLGPSLLFEPELQASPPDSVTLLGPRGSVSSHFCVGRTGLRLGVLSHSPPLPLTSFFIFSLTSSNPSPSSQGLLGDLPCPPGYPCLETAFVLPSLPSQPLLSFPIPAPSSPCLAPLSIRAPHHLPGVLLGFFSPCLLTVYLSLSCPGGPQRPCFCPSL